MFRPLPIIPVILLTLLLPTAAFAQGDLTVFLGAAYPVYDDRLTLRPSVPSLPGVAVSAASTPELRANGGLVFGAALAFELGILGIEGRLDSTEVGLDLTAGQYDVRGTTVPFQGLTGNIQIGAGHFDADRLHLLSINARLRTPGPVGLVASGGLSYLPEIVMNGSVPLSANLAGIALPAIAPRLRLRAAPGESDSRVGLNGGAGIRIGGKRMALMAEARVFYFRDFELRFDVDGAPGFLADLLDGLAPITFEPVIVNAQAGLVFKF
jgi:hypothetical protein